MLRGGLREFRALPDTRAVRRHVQFCVPSLLWTCRWNIFYDDELVRDCSVHKCVRRREDVLVRLHVWSDVFGLVPGRDDVLVWLHVRVGVL